MSVSWISDPSVVQTIDTTTFSSSDPSGLTYIPGDTPGTGQIILVDSEVEERSNNTNNMFTLTETGVFVSATDLVSDVTKEPTGITYSPDGNVLYITDDDLYRIDIVSASDPSVLLGSIDVSAISTDTEDPYYNTASGHLFFLEGGGGVNHGTIYECTASGQVIATITLPKAVGDVEAMTYDPVHDVFYVCGGTSPDIYVVSRDGTLLDTITVLEGMTNPISGVAVAPKGLVLAPSSDPTDDPSVMSLWVADYGRDNTMDGNLIEISLGDSGTGTTLPPTFTSGADVFDFNTSVPGSTDPAQFYTALDGDDLIILPATEAAAALAGYSTKVAFSAGAGDDTVTGGALKDSIDGGTGNDVIYGGAGQDLLIGGGGNDSVDGGADTDTLMLSGNRADYTFVLGPDGVVVITGTGTGAADGTDWVVNVENVTFLDGTMSMDALVHNVAPSYLGFAGVVTENAVAGTVVGTATAIDPNSGGGDTVRFSLVDNADGMFAINAVTGVVTLVGPVDAEMNLSYDITIRATDSGGLVRDETVTISVGDVNEFGVTVPADANLAANTVADGAAIGALVGITARATDADATNHAVTYSLSDDAGGKFAIDATTGVVTVAGNIDQATDGSVFTVEVTATSSDGSHQTESFTVNVAGVTDFTISDGNSGADTVLENAVLGSAVGIVAVADQANSPGNTFTYSLSDDAGGMFAIDASTGIVTVAGPIDRETAGASVTIEVMATSSDGTYQTQNFTIAIGDVNEFALMAPLDANSATNAVTETAQIGTVVGITARTRDLDATANHVTYSLSDNAGGLFAIDAETGVVTVAGALNYDLAQNYSVTVKATSDDGSWAETVFNIDVINVATSITVTLSSSSNTYKVTTSDNYIIDGQGGNDSITGGQGDDTITGGTGNDTLIGGGGNDTFLFGTGSNGTDFVDGGTGSLDRIVATAAGVTIGLYSISGIEIIDSAGLSGLKIAGTSASNSYDLSGVTIIGAAVIDLGGGSDTFTGSNGDDVIIGGSGNDILDAGAGNDTFLVGTSAGTDLYMGGAGTDRVVASADAVTISVTTTTLSSIEDISSGGYSGFKLKGTSSGDLLDFSSVVMTGVTQIDASSGSDTVIGSNGADVIIGGSSNDVLYGGGGDDIFRISTSAGTDTFDGGAGTGDRIEASTNSVVMTVTSTNITSIEEISSAGYSGFTLKGTSSSEVLNFSSIILTGVVQIDGGSGNDTITGSAGADTLTGGSSTDVLTGGFGADTFDFNSTSESKVGAQDTITDFVQGTDQIDLSTIDANTLVSGDQGFIFIGTAAFSGVAGQLRYDTSTPGETHILCDTNGNGTVDFDIRITGTISFTAADILL